MSTVFTNLPIRLLCDLAARNAVIDLNTNQAPSFYRGDDIEVDIGIALDGAILTGLVGAGAGGIASVSLQLFQSENDNDAPLMSATVLAAAMNFTLTQLQWTNGEGAPGNCHAAFLFANAVTGISLNGAASANYWLRITAQTSDATAKTITLLDGPITVLDGPYNTLASPVANGTKLVTDQGVPNVPALWDPVTQAYYALEVTTVGGARVVGLSDQAF